MIKQLHQEANICNFHISTLNLERSTRLILEALDLHKEVNIKCDLGQLVQVKITLLFFYVGEFKSNSKTISLGT